jgi:hypothetical protein
MKYQKIAATHIWKKKHLTQFIAGIVGYGFMLPITIFIGKKIEVGLFVQTLFALLPVLPFLFAMYAYIVNFKTMDEMWRNIQSQALIITAMVTIAFSFSLGMLQVMNIIPLFSIFYLFPFMTVIWLISFSYLITKNKLL